MITVVITSYKYGKYLKGCIQSVLDQTYKDIEIIVVSDGSTDETRDVCKEMGIRCIHQENSGACSARNNGIKEAKGKYIMCLDADDILPPNSIAEHMSMVGGKKIAQCALTEFGGSNSTNYPRGADIKSLLWSNSVYCNAVFPKKAWEEVGGYDTSDTMRLGYEDWEFWIRLADAGYKFVTSFTVGLLYRVHDASMTRTQTHKHHALLTSYIRNKHAGLYTKYNIR